MGWGFLLNREAEVLETVPRKTGCKADVRKRRMSIDRFLSKLRWMDSKKKGYIGVRVL